MLLQKEIGSAYMFGAYYITFSCGTQTNLWFLFITFFCCTVGSFWFLFMLFYSCHCV